MKPFKFILLIVMLVVLASAHSAQASNVAFTFTGTGVNGSHASGTFTVAEGALVPGYIASGSIYPSLSLTISNIPGPGPSTFSLSLPELDSVFYVHTNLAVYVAPYGSKGYGFPDQNHYDLGQAAQPFSPSPTFVTGLGYNGVGVDLITWSVATAVPEPSSAALMIVALAAGFFALRGRMLRRAA